MVKNKTKTINKKPMSRTQKYKKLNQAIIKKHKKKPVIKKRSKIVRKPITKKSYRKIRKVSPRIKRRRKVRLVKRIIKIIIIILLIFGIYLIKQGFNKVNSKKNDYQTKLREKQKQDYQKCLGLPYSKSEITTQINSYITSLNDYFALNYNAGIYYEDLKTGFNYQYQKTKNFYAASTIKMLDAIYLYEKAIQGDISLDQKITYKAKHKIPFSKGMENYKIGSKVTLRQLVNYAISYSDNTAHEMLVEYIGKQQLKDYGNSLGATLTLNEADNFGQINTTDAIIYLKKLNTLFANQTYGAELKTLFLGADQNYLANEAAGIKAVHKYGNFKEVYNDLGIVYDENPYYIVILTNNGYSDQEQLIKKINAKIYDLHQLFINARAINCHNKIYK